GQSINLSNFKDKVILVVNTASKCGFTPQYEGLQKLHEKYKDKGLVIIGVPSADFASQEFSQISQVKEFTDKEFHITFPLTEIEKVKGKEAHPFYLWANSKSGFIGSPKWNFHKYLIDKNGNFASWFSSPTKPNSPKIIDKIEELL
ncbi:redoxin domain-containing protein, partial [Flavobacteriaceae bacterium]|nr:redoxin domain-containing protein [Flavobacteriaceae bacterium]